MADEVALKLTVDAVNAAQSVKELKKIIVDAKSEALKFGEGTAEFAKFANVAAQAAAKLNNVKEQMAVLDPEAKARAFTQLGNAIVGGFTAAQGAAALFGANVDDVQKTLLKVQSAMALLQGFQAVQDGVKAFGAMRAMILLNIESLNGLKAAMVSTGLGAFLVLIGGAVAMYMKLSDANNAATDAQERYNKMVKQSQKDLNESFTKIIEEGNKAAIERAKASGKSLEYIYSLEKKAIEQQIDFLDNSDKDYVTKKQLLNDQLTALDIQFQNDKKARDEKAREESEKAFTEKKAKDSPELKYAKDIDDGLIKQASDTQAKLQKIQVDSGKALENITKTTNRSVLAELLSFADARIEIENSVLSVVANIGNIAIKNKQKAAEFEKKVASVRILVNEAEALASSINEASKNPFPANLVAIATSVATVTAMFAQVRQLFSKAGDIGGAPNLSSSSNSIAAPALSSSTPGVNFLNQPNTNLNGNNQQVNNTINIPNTIKAIVVESEVTGVQNGVTKIKNQALIG